MVVYGVANTNDASHCNKKPCVKKVFPCGLLTAGLRNRMTTNFEMTVFLRLNNKF